MSGTTSKNVNQIPVVDFAAFRSGTPNETKEIANSLYEAFRDVGFVYLKNHGVPQDVVDEAFTWVSSLCICIQFRDIVQF